MKVAFHPVFDNPVRMGCVRGWTSIHILAERLLIVVGYKHPERILTIVQECYKAATERILQALATKVTHSAP